MARMNAPESGVTVRMYRQGHGDCFLIAARGTDGKPVYLLIDCGMKKGSSVDGGPSFEKVIDDIRSATGGHIHAVAITHEHEDHVTGFMVKSPKPGVERCWDEIDIGETWLAWTEDGSDTFANQLREEFGDTLIALFGASMRFHAAGDSEKADAIDKILAFETGEDALERVRSSLLGGTALSGEAAFNLTKQDIKEAIKYVRDKAKNGVRFLDPDEGPIRLPGVEGVRIWTLGPPRDKTLLKSADPRRHEEFHLALAQESDLRGFCAAAEPGDRPADAGQPFAARHGIALTNDDFDLPNEIGESDEVRNFFDGRYRAPDAAWRRIDRDWLDAAEALAIRINREVNNTSLVLAIELEKSGDVLLFTGDAQRGNWISWADRSWGLSGGDTVTARDLLERCVFYKVGHHGSHNATLSGSPEDDHPNLSWIASRASQRNRFAAMIPSNEPWALGKRPHPWRHPLRAIADALDSKADGRVLQLDMTGSQDVKAEHWARRSGQVAFDKCYIELQLPDNER